MSDTIINCQDLSIGYKMPLKSGITFNIGSNELFVLKGKNGSGKTTIIKTLLRDLKPLSGNIDYSIAKGEISYLPQITNPKSNYSYTIEEILSFYETPQKIKETLIGEIKSKKWVDASGGEKQKTMILTRLNLSTRLLILDEPFNHLDIEGIQILTQTLKDLLNQNNKLSILLVSHIELDKENINYTEYRL